MLGKCIRSKPQAKMKKNKVLLWLDDARDPSKWRSLAPSGTSDYQTVWVKSYDEFLEYLVEQGIPDAVSFDHDLEPEHYVPSDLWKDYDLARYWMKENDLAGTGYHCAVALIRRCKMDKVPIPKWGVHSANPVGANDIRGILQWTEDRYKIEGKWW